MFKINYCDLILDGIKEGDQIGDNMQHKKLITALTFLCVIGSTSLVIGEVINDNYFPK